MYKTLTLRLSNHKWNGHVYIRRNRKNTLSVCAIVQWRRLCMSEILSSRRKAKVKPFSLLLGTASNAIDVDHGLFFH